jgi:hypothetical protein
MPEATRQTDRRQHVAQGARQAPEPSRRPGTQWAKGQRSPWSRALTMEPGAHRGAGRSPWSRALTMEPGTTTRPQV